MISIFVFSFSSTMPTNVHAQLPAVLPYGGAIVFALPCPCSFSILHIVFGARSLAANIVPIPGVTLFRWFSVLPGSWANGIAAGAPGYPCVIPVPVCVSIGNYPATLRLGTSMPGGVFGWYAALAASAGLIAVGVINI